MAATGSLVQIEQIEQLEEVLRGLQQSTANTMLHEREAMSLSLREVSLKVRLTAAARLWYLVLRFSLDRAVEVLARF
jgi:hypothetical protein